MNIEAIAAAARRAVSRCGTRDPYDLCRGRGILMIRAPMGAAPGACKGFAMTCARRMSVVVNADLDEDLARIVCAHELGHCVLHCRLTSGVFRDHDLFCDRRGYEYEANVFAAEVLIPDSAVRDALNATPDFFDAARLIGVPPEVLDFKLRVMKRMGRCRLNIPITASGDFLRRCTGAPPQ